MSAYNTSQALAWDSDFLGFGVARVTARHLAADHLAGLRAAARRSQQRLLYVVADPADEVSATALAGVGARLADRKVTFGMAVPPAEATLAVAEAVRPTITLTPALDSLARQSGEYSRFRLDPNFAAGVFERLYGQWLRNSLSHALAREVLVYGPADAALGLLTLGVKGSRADIGLLAVDEAARGQRIGQQLVAAARQRTAAWGLPELQVVTQLDNEPACAFYRRCGFAEWQLEHIYHLWL